MSWETTDVLSADTTDVLSADTTDVLPADTTDVLSADTTGLSSANTGHRIWCYKGTHLGELCLMGWSWEAWECARVGFGQVLTKVLQVWAKAPPYLSYNR